MKTNRDIVRQQLVTWCAPGAADKAYYRPFVCRGNVEEVSLFIVPGIPAVPVPPPLDYPGLDREQCRVLHGQLAEKYPVADFAGRLTDEARAREMFDEVRSLIGKDDHGPARERLDRFVQANPLPDESIAEISINAYPARDAAALKKEDRRIVERGYDIFFNCLQLFRPAWLILLGKPAVDEASLFFSTRFGVPDFRGKWKDLNSRNPQLIALAAIKLGGSKCRIAASRSFDKRPVKGLPDSEYSDARFEHFCREAWTVLRTAK